MSDAEWNAWQSSWTGATGPLPDVRARAKREALLHRMAGVLFFLLVAIAAAGSVSAFTDPDPAVHVIGWMILAFDAAMSIGYLAIQRGIGLRRIGTPREALAFLERRLEVERRAALLVRWSYVGILIACAFVFPPLMDRQHAPLWERLIVVGWLSFVFVTTFTAPWWGARLSRRLRNDVDRWRRWMDQQQL